MILPRTAQQALHQKYRILQRHIRMALSKTATNVVRVSAVAAFIGILLVATLVFHVQDHIGELVQWIQDNKVVGSVCFIALYALFTGDEGPAVPAPLSLDAAPSACIYIA